MTEIDPNLDLALSVAYTGGIRAPVVGQEGYLAVVNSTGLNLEYIEPGVKLSDTTLKTSSSVQVGRQWTHNAQIVVSTTATFDLMRVEMPEGCFRFEIIVTGKDATGAEWYLERRVYLARQFSGTLTLSPLCDNDSGGTMTTTVSISASADDLAIQIIGNVADGTVTWTGTLFVVEHTL